MDAELVADETIVRRPLHRSSALFLLSSPSTGVTLLVAAAGRSRPRWSVRAASGYGPLVSEVMAYHDEGGHR